MQINRKKHIVSRKKVTEYIVKVLLLLATLISASAIILIVYQLADRGIRPLFSAYTIESYDGSLYENVRLNIRYFFTGTEYIGFIKDFGNGKMEAAYGIGYLIINTIFNVTLSLLLAT